MCADGTTADLFTLNPIEAKTLMLHADPAAESAQINLLCCQPGSVSSINATVYTETLLQIVNQARDFHLHTAMTIS